MINEDIDIQKEIQNLASLFFSKEEIATMLELSAMDFMDGCKYYRSYMKGKLQGEVNLRTSVSKLANSGSSPAQTMMLDILRKTDAKNITQWQR